MHRDDLLQLAVHRTFMCVFSKLDLDPLDSLEFGDSTKSERALSEARALKALVGLAASVSGGVSIGREDGDASGECRALAGLRVESLSLLRASSRVAALDITRWLLRFAWVGTSGSSGSVDVEGGFLATRVHWCAFVLNTLCFLLLTSFFFYFLGVIN